MWLPPDQDLLPEADYLPPGRVPSGAALTKHQILGPQQANHQLETRVKHALVLLLTKYYSISTDCEESCVDVECVAVSIGCSEVAL